MRCVNAIRLYASSIFKAVTRLARRDCGGNRAFSLGDLAKEATVTQQSAIAASLFPKATKQKDSYEMDQMIACLVAASPLVTKLLMGCRAMHAIACEANTVPAV